MTAKSHIHNGDQLAWIKQEPDAGLEEYRKALEIDPTLAVAHWRIGQLHFFAALPRTDEAIAAFREAVRCAPKWSEAHYWLGLSLAQKKRYQESIKEHREAIALSEQEDERLFISLGRCLYENGNFSLAVKAYEDGIRVARHEEAYYYLLLADALFAIRQTKEACREWKRALALRLVGYAEDDELVREARTKLAVHCRG